MDLAGDSAEDFHASDAVARIRKRCAAGLAAVDEVLEFKLQRFGAAFEDGFFALVVVGEVRGDGLAVIRFYR